MGMRSFVSALKSKFKEDKSKRTVYLRMDRSESMKADANSKRAQKLIAKTLKAADKSGVKPLS